MISNILFGAKLISFLPAVFFFLASFITLILGSRSLSCTRFDIQMDLHTLAGSQPGTCWFDFAAAAAAILT